MRTLRDQSSEASRVEALKDPGEAAAYFDAVLSMDDPGALQEALRQIDTVSEVAPRTCR